MPVSPLPRPRAPRFRRLFLALSLLPALLAPQAASRAQDQGAAPAEESDRDGYVAHDCPIEGQDGAIVLGTGGAFQSACLALSRPQAPGPWNAADKPRIDGSSQFCPRPVLSVLDRGGAVTIRFLDAAPGSFLADPAACCRAAGIAVDPRDGSVRIATGGPAADCFGGGAIAGAEDLYRWDGDELTFVESRR